MNQLQTTTTSFNTIELIERNGKQWIAAHDLSQAIGYKRSDAVARIYERNQDEFTKDMSDTVKLTVSGNLKKTVRLFSLRGAHLIAMFARTKAAKEFRKWVLDLIECEARPHETPHRVLSILHWALQKKYNVKSYKDIAFDDFKTAHRFVMNFDFAIDAPQALGAANEAGSSDLSMALALCAKHMKNDDLTHGERQCLKRLQDDLLTIQRGRELQTLLLEAA